MIFRQSPVCPASFLFPAIVSCFSTGFSALLIADDQDMKIYDRENDREMELIPNQLRMGALDYIYDPAGSSVIWTDTSSKVGKFTT